MSSKVVVNQEHYVRLLDDEGVAYSNSNKLPVDAVISSATVSQATPSNLKSEVSNAGTFAVQVDGDALTDLDTIAGDTTSIDGKLPALDGSGYVAVQVKNASLAVTNASPSSSQIFNNASTGTSLSSNKHAVSGPNVSVFGVVDGACTLTLMLGDSSGGSFYEDINTFEASGAGDVALHCNTGAKYLALKSSADVTATLYISTQ